MFDWVLNTPMKKNAKKRNNWSIDKTDLYKTVHLKSL